MMNSVYDFVKMEFSGNYGMIFTYIWAFDQKSDWDYIEHVKSIFKPYNTDLYCVELITTQEVRLERNITENRLKNKASKRNLECSRANNILLDEKYRKIGKAGEVPFDNYLRIDNTNITPEETQKWLRMHLDYRRIRSVINFPLYLQCNNSEQQIKE